MPFLLEDSFRELRTMSIAKVKKIREHFGVSRAFLFLHICGFFVFIVHYLSTDVAFPILFLTVGVGEVISVGVFGIVLLLALEKTRKVLFAEK